MSEKPKTEAAPQHKVSKLPNSDSEFVYRGIHFERNDSKRGYWGHYHTSFKLGRSVERAGTRKQLLAAIDEYLDRSHTEPIK